LFVTELHEGKMYLLNSHSIDRDGTYEGYDIDLKKFISKSVTIPIVALSGASNYIDFNFALHAGFASAISAGSIFVYHGPCKTVLISLPSNLEIKKNLINVLLFCIKPSCSLSFI